MTLFETLAKATSEEDVKAAYIKALGLKNVRRNLIDIQTNEVWFEAKLGSKCSVYYMFTELLNYVWKAQKDGEQIPPFLCVIDSVKAALMKTDVALPFFKDKSINIRWGRSASDVTPEALDDISNLGVAPEDCCLLFFADIMSNGTVSTHENLPAELIHKNNRPDVGWYQVRNALKLYGESAEGHPTDFTAFEAAYKALGDKLRPQVYSYGFLRT